jgi:hypothetical protein
MHRVNLQRKEQFFIVVALAIILCHTFYPIEGYLISNHFQQVVRRNSRLVYSQHGCTLLRQEYRKFPPYPVVPLLLHQWRQSCSTMSRRKTTLRSATTDTTTASSKLVAPSAATTKLPVAETKEASGAGASTDSGSKRTKEEAVLTPLLPVRPFPMELIVDQNIAKEALLLAAVNPNIHGLVIGGRRGTGKTVLARSIRSILPPITTIATTTPVPCPFVDVPLNVMEDSLVGTIDLEQSLETGQTMFSPGLLARAHNGVLHVDDINLLEEEAANVLLNVVNEGWVHVEREGLSVEYPCKPCLFVATFNPEEGEFREHLQDRVGIALTLDTASLSVKERVDAVDHVIGYTTMATPTTPSSASENNTVLPAVLQKVEEHEKKMQQRICYRRRSRGCHDGRQCNA